METQPTEQAPAPSVSDRIANIFNPQPSNTAPEEPKSQQAETASEPEAPQGETQAAPVEDTFELEVEGEKFVLPKKLEKGFMQERDYTQKSQTLAEQRKTIELLQEQARLAQSQQQFGSQVSEELRQLQIIDTLIKQGQSIDWSSMSTDDIVRKGAELSGYERQRNALVQAIEGKRQEWDKKFQSEIDGLRAKSLETLQKRIPGWSNDLAKAVREHALSEGYTDAELSSVIDPRHAVTLWKAQQFDKLQANAQKTVQTAKVVKTTPTNPMPQEVKDKLNFRNQLKKTSQHSPERRRIVEDRVASIFSR